MRSANRFMFVTLVAWLILSGAAYAGVYEITKIADLDTPVPGGTGNFTSFADPRALPLEDGSILFHARGSEDREGFYAFSEGVLKAVVDFNTALPGETGTFDALCCFVLFDNGFLFPGAAYTDGIGPGLYVQKGGRLETLVAPGTPIPDGSGIFTDFGLRPLALGDGQVMFIGGDSVQSGVYTNYYGPLETVLDLNTPIPNGMGHFGRVTDGLTRISESKVIFYQLPVGHPSEGIFAFDLKTRSLEDLVTTETKVPGFDSNFGYFGFGSLGAPTTAEESFVFVGRLPGSTQRVGIYRYARGTLEIVADINTAIPEGSGNFTFFREGRSIRVMPGGKLVFIASGDNLQEGIYTELDGSFTKVVDTNVPIPEASGNFTGFEHIDVTADGSIFFDGGGLSIAGHSQRGIYRYKDGAIQKVVDTLTVLPDGSNVGYVDLAQADGPDRVIFRGHKEPDVAVQYGFYIAALVAGEVKGGSIIIAKSTSPGGADGFNFNGSSSEGFPNTCELDNFSLGDGETKGCTELAPGVYTFAETLPSNWELNNITCNDQGIVSIDLNNKRVQISLQEGDRVSCTFESVLNSPSRGSITVTNQTTPSDGTEFSFGGDLGAFTLMHAESRSAEDLAPGSYSITEIVPTGWSLQDIACDGPTAPVAGGVRVDLDSRAHVSCTFKNVSATARGLSDVVILATNGVTLNAKARIVSGSVIDNASSGRIIIGKGATTPAGFEVIAHELQIAKKATVSGDALFNVVDNKGNVVGSQISPVGLPAITELPPFHDANAGSADVVVAKKDSSSLTPGSYGNVILQKNAALVLNAGIYDLASIRMDKGAKITYQGAVEVRIRDGLVAAKKNLIGPGSGADASDAIFYIGGSQASLGKRGDIRANLYVPNGGITFGKQVRATGAFIAQTVEVGKKSTIALASFFER